MREFLKKIFSRRPPQQLGLEVGPHSALSRVPNDYSWLIPPITLVDPAPWDMFWYEQISHGVGDFVHLFCGIFFSQSHNGRWKPPTPCIHALESWFRAEGWSIWPIDGALTTRVAWLFTTTG